MMPGMEDPRAAALARAMGGMGGEDPMAGMPPEGEAAPADPTAELSDIAMRLEALLPQLDPTVAEQIAQLLPVLQGAAQPKPQGDVPPEMGMGGGVDEMMGMGAPV